MAPRRQRMIDQPSNPAHPRTGFDPDGRTDNVIRFPPRPLLRPATAASGGDAVLALREASGALTAAFVLLETNAHALGDSCRGLDKTTAAISAVADTMARRTDALTDSTRAFRTRLVALATADA